MHILFLESHYKPSSLEKKRTTLWFCKKKTFKIGCGPLLFLMKLKQTNLHCIHLNCIPCCAGLYIMCWHPEYRTVLEESIWQPYIQPVGIEAFKFFCICNQDLHGVGLLCQCHDCQINHQGRIGQLYLPHSEAPEVGPSSMVIVNKSNWFGLYSGTADAIARLLERDTLVHNMLNLESSKTFYTEFSI